MGGGIGGGRYWGDDCIKKLSDYHLIDCTSARALKM